MKKKINERIFEITQILQNQELLNSIGISLNNGGVTSKKFYDSMKESEVTTSSIFGNNTLNSIQNKENGFKRGLSLEEILALVEELKGFIVGINSVKLNFDQPLKKGDELIAIDECQMDDDPEEKCLTIGKVYPVFYINMINNRICIIDDYNHEHFFYFGDIHKFFEIKK